MAQQNDLSGKHSWWTKHFVGILSLVDRKITEEIYTKAAASVLLCFNEKADGCEVEREED